MGTNESWGEVTMTVMNEMSWASWDFLDALGFQSSPIRQHVRQLFNREDLEEQLQGLFDALSGGLPALDKGGFLNFSSNIRGQVHVLMDMKTKISTSMQFSLQKSLWTAQPFLAWPSWCF
eukprot:g23733.t1